MLQLKTNVDNHKVTFQPQILKAILDSCEKEKHNYYDEFYDYYKTDSEKEELIKILLNDFDSDTEILADIIRKCYKGQCGDLLKITDKYGFSHTQDYDSPDSPDIMHYIVYDLDAITIQNIENLKTI